MDTLLDNDIVISGIGGYFPNSMNYEEFEKHLLANEDLLTSRWPEGEKGVNNRLGVMPKVQYFDATFFAIHRHQAMYMDPMQRIALERTFEALVDAGVSPQDVRGRKIGVYMGSTIGENDSVFYESLASGFGVTGHSRAMLANRISYWLNLKGPSCAYDSNWLSGFDILQIAYNAIKAGHIEAAVVGTANLALNSDITFLYNDIGLISSDGITRPFDENANGYARSDGIVVFYLQRASEARRVRASIVNVGTRFYGNYEGAYLDKDVNCMTEYLEEFVKESNVDLNDVEYLETYGCGIKSIDETELESIERVYCKNRTSPLLIGSVKPNTGHSEPSAGLFSICKAIVAMESGIIPATLNFKTPNSNIKGLQDGSLQVVTTNTKYNGGIVAVNAIALTNGIGHIFLKPNPRTRQETASNLPALFIASTRTEEGMKEILEQVAAMPTVDPEFVALSHTTFSSSINAHLYRGYKVLGENTDGLEGTEYNIGNNNNKRQIWFVYSGMGSQWTKMGSDLMQLPIFAESIQRSHNILAKEGIDLINIITSEDKTIFENILHSFVGIAAIQIALTDILRALDIVPDGIIGHSVGELGCAYGDGALTAEEMILCAYSRGRASLEATLIQGMMAAVGLGYNQIKDMLPPSIEVACHNGPDSSTISGPTEDMEKFVKELQDKGIFARLVNVANIAYHSRYIKPAGPLLLEYLKEVIKTPKLRSSKWVSTSAPENKWNTEEAKYSSAEYHTNNLLGSVLFEEGSRHIPKDSIVIEIAPHGLLQAILKRSLANGCTNIPLTNRQAKNTLNFLLNSIGKMYLSGMDINPSKIFPKVEFPVSRGTPPLSSMVRWEHGETWRIGIEHKINYMVSVKELNLGLADAQYKKFQGHQMDGNVILPITFIFSLILEIMEKNTNSTVKTMILEDLRFDQQLVVPKIGFANIFLIYQKGTGKFEVTSDNKIIGTGILKVPGVGDEFMHDIIDFKQTDDFIQLNVGDVYNELLHRGHEYKAPYKPIKSIKLMEEGSVAVLNPAEDWQTLLEGMIQQVIFRNGEKYQNVVLPKSIARITISLDQLNGEQEETISNYNYITGILSAPGIQITNVKTKAISSNKAPVYFGSLEFSPFENSDVMDFENIINASFNMVMENFHEIDCTNINVTEIETSNPSFMAHIKKALVDYVELSVNISTSNENQLHSHVSSNTPSLFVVNDVINEKILNVLKSSDIFVLAKSDKNILNHINIIEFASFYYGNERFSLLRKVSTENPLLIHVKEDVLTIREDAEFKWTQELKNATNNSLNKVYLVSKTQPLEGIPTFRKELNSLEQFKHVRCLFLLDKSSPDILQSSELYSSLFRKDPMLAIFNKGQIGTMVHVPVNIKANAKSQVYCPSQMENRTIRYIGINLKDETIGNNNVKNETGNLDYVSTTQQGDAYAGLAFLDAETCKFVADPVLKWKVLPKYSLEDACTFPHAYTTAFYCLVLKGELFEGSTVLLHSGCTAIGFACIAIAISRKCKVYTTVETHAQKAYLKSTFPMIPEENIMFSTNLTFETQFMTATSGLGADIIVNNLSGSFMQATSRCLGILGKFIQLGKYDMEENNFIGLRMFLKNNSFHSVIPEDMFFLPNEEKQKLQELVQEEMYFKMKLNRKTVVTKMGKDTITEILSSLRDGRHIGKILIKMSDDFQVNKLSHDKSVQFMCDTKASYFIYGGIAETWADMVEWLILRGARKVVVSSDSKPQHAYITRRLSLLQSYFQADIVYTPEKAMTKDSAAELLSEVYYLGPIHAVFFLPNKMGFANVNDVKALQHVETALRTVAPKALLVNFVSLANGHLQHRIDAGFPTLSVSSSTVNFKKLLNSIDEVVQMNVKNVQVKYEKITDFEEETTQMLYRKLLQLLPTQEDIEDKLNNSEEEIKLEQLHSLTPRQIRSVPPLFLMPGISNFNHIKELAKKMYFPVFYPKIPIKGVEYSKLAAVLAEKIAEVYPKGPYNLVAMSVSSVTAIETAKILKKRANVLVMFIDSPPDKVQASLKLLGDGSLQEVNLLTRILGIENFNSIEAIRHCNSWADRLETAVNCAKFENKNALKELICSYRDYIAYVSDYKPSGELLAGKIILARPTGSNKFDNCGLLKYCKETPDVEIVSVDHSTLLLHKDLAELINNRVALK